MATDDAARPALTSVADARFSGADYAGCTGHHRAHDGDVLGPVAWRPGMRVLDLGCGVGDLTTRVADLVAPGEVLGVDSSASQVEQARTAAVRPGLRFEVARAQQLDRVVAAGWADVVLSVAVLHWVTAPDQPVVLAQVARALAPEGVFRLDMGGAGQIADTRAILDEVAAEHDVAPAAWFFPDEQTMTDLLAAAGLVPQQVQLRRQRRHLADATALEGWLRSQVLPGYGRVVELAGERSERRPDDPAEAVPAQREVAFADEAVRRCLAALCREDGSYDQHYVRLDAVAGRA